MKIAILNNLYEPYQRGGAEQVVKRQVNEMKQAGHEVILISTAPRQFKNNNKAGQNLQSSPLIKTDDHTTYQDDVKIYHLPSWFYNLSSRPIWWRLLWQITNLFSWIKSRQIGRILKKEGPDRIISHNLMGLGFMTPLIIKKLGIYHEHWLHDIQLLHPSGLIILGQEAKLEAWLARLYQFFTRRFLSTPQQVVSPSRWLLNEHVKKNFFPSAKTTINNFSLELITRISSESASTLVSGVSSNKKTNPDPDSVTYLFVGQIEDHKGPIFLINIFKRLPSQQAQLIIVGDGSQLTQAQNLARNDRRIKFLGRLSAKDVNTAMTRADYLLVPSLCYENSPTVIHEAHALNLPVIAAAIGGIPEIINSADKLFPAGDEEALLSILTKFSPPS